MRYPLKLFERMLIVMKSMTEYMNMLNELERDTDLPSVYSIKDIDNIDDERHKRYILYKLNLLILRDFVDYIANDVGDISPDKYHVMAEKYATSALISVRLMSMIAESNSTTSELILFYSAVKSFLDKAPSADIQEKLKMHVEVVERAS